MAARLLVSALVIGAFALSAAAQTSQTITFNALAGKTYGAASFTVSATASSGLVVSFASLTTPVCTVSAATVTVIAVGTCTIQASQAGDATYAPAPSVNQSFTVAKAAQTISFAALTGQTYGNPPFTVSATASSSLVVTFVSTTTAVCTVSGTIVNIVAGGTCTIQAQQAGNSNYNAAPNVNQSFTVAKASQTITFGALANKNYGDPPFTVSATASTGLAVSFSSSTVAVCTVSGNTVTLVAGGTCTIKASQAGNTNYLAATAVSQSFAVAKLSQTITFAALANKIFGDPPFAVSATASSGLAMTFSSLTTAVCTVSGSTVTIKTGGTCTIQAAQAGNGIYNAAPSVSQSFTVAKLSQTITFGALANQTYGVAPFTVGATASSGLAVTFSSLTTTVCTVSGSTVTIKTGGTCTIQAAQAGNTSYNAAPSVSQSFTVAKANQTLTFGALANQTYGATPFTVSATASSGLAVTFSSLTIAACTVSGSTVTIKTGGTCTIQAAQAGNTSYNAAPSVSQSFTIAKANQTITFGALANKTYGVAPFTVSATASSGLAVTFSSLTAPLCTVSGSTVTLVAVGTCTIQAAQAGNASYNAAASVSQSFTVATGSQTITFAALASKTYGVAPFTVSATASSGLAVTFSSLTTPVCTVSGNTVTLIAVGTCTIDAAQAGNANYNAATDVTQSFAVGKASQTITFGVLANKAYGVAPFTVSATVSSGLAVTFVSTTTAVCTVSGTTVTIVAVGTCTIQAQQAGNNNYNAATSVNQSFTVAKAVQTITFNALSAQTYGAAPFTVSATASSGLPVAFASLTTTVCTVSGTTLTILAGGTCTIQASQAGNTNYLAATAVSQSFTVGKANQTITFGALANKSYGAAPFTVSATASSGLAVAFSSLTTAVCTVSGTTVTLVGSGTCTVQAAQAGNTSYNAAPNVSQSFSVGLASQTISFATIPQQMLGAIPPTLSATASSGLPVAFASLTSAVCTVSGTTLTLIAAGTCTIQASQAGNASYAAAPNVNQSFAVITQVQFASQVMYSVGYFPWGVATGDFNGDGKLDVVVANMQDGTVSIFVGDGAGGLIASATYTTGGIFPESIVTGDFNGDGKLDLAVVNFYSKTVAILLGNGNGTFQSPRIINVGGYPTALAAADLNRDGKLDLVVADGSSGSDVGQTVEVLLGIGDGTFQPGVSYATGQSPNGVASVDLNGDGKLDLAVTNSGSNTLSILLGNGDGTFQPAVNYPTAYYPEMIAAADLNRDGKADLVVLNSLINTVSIFLGNGNGTFAPRSDIAAGQAPQGLAIADFNGDGNPDLAIANSFDDDVSVLLGKGDGTFYPPTLLITGIYPAGVAAADLNRDDKPDLIVANYQSNTVSVLLNTSNYSSAASVTPVAGTPQSAPVNTVYAAALAAIVRDISSNPLPGTVVTFTAPSSGASGTFSGSGASAQATTNASGVATAPTFTANGTAGSFSVVARAGTASGSFVLTNTAGNSPAFTSAPPPNGTVNLAYSYTVTASGTPAPTFSVVANSLPPGLALNGISGLLSGTPNTIGTFAGTLTAANGALPNATQAFAITIAGSAQTISFAALANKPWGTAPFAVSATASSGLTVSFASLTTSVCTASGATVTLVNLGSCTIQASQSGNAAYAPAPSVNQSFTVTQASQTIAFGPIGNKPLGTPPFAVSATASSGLLVYFASLTTSVCTVSGSTVTLVAAGTCTIRASQPGSTYYTAAPNVDQSFAVSTNQAPTIALTMPANNSSYVAPAIVPMVATASDPDGTINRVEFYNGGVPLATATTAPYTFAWSNVAAGSYVLTAKAYDSANAITTSAAATITVNASGSTVAFVHTGDYPVGNYTQAVALGDFNRDGNPDVVALTGGVWMLSGSAAGVLQQASTLPGLVGSAVATGDLNGDGIVDVATVSGSGLQVALGNGDGTFRSPTSYAIGNGGAQRSIIAKDLNGDGKLDLAVANDTDGTVSILIGNGDGTFRAAVAYPAGTGPTGIAAGDFNGDGNMDLVAANRTGMAAVDGFTLLLGNGDGTFRAPTTKVTGTGVGYIAAGDLNGDGKLDLAIADPFGKVAILLGNGDGTFQSLFEYPAGGFALGIVIADLNGDGKLDIATANLSDNTVSILLGNGNGSFRAPMNFAVGVQPVHLAVGDLNSDGLPDLVVDNIGAATVSVLINATGKTAQAPTFTNGAPPAGPGGSPYSFTFTASGFPGSAFHLASSLTWFSFSASGTLSSASAVPGIYQGVVTASNGIAPDATQAFTIYIARKNQTITFPALPDTYIGNGTHLTGWATASSGLPVSFVSLTPSICNLLVAPPIIDLNVPAAGSCVVRAEQPGDGYFAPAPPVDRTFTVTPSPTAHLGPAGVVITAPADGAGFVAPATITLTSDAWVVSIWPPMSIYYVEYFYDGGQSAGITATYAPPPYTVTWSNVPVGTHVLTARLKYILTGDPTYYGYATSAPITIAVTAVPDQPVVTLTAPANNSGYITPASITLVASASDPVTSIARVEFYAGGVLIGSTTTAPYTFTWANGPVGTFAITARAVNSVGVTANSQPITITVDSGIATQVAAYTFNDAWDSSGLVLDILGGFAGVRQGAVTQVAAAASGPKPDTCQAASFAGGAIDIIDLPVAIIGGAKTTVAFWMYWNGGDLQMPVTWTAQGLLLSAGSFGFTTQNNNDVFGIASAFLANGWHHVVAEFTNGNVTNNRLWIDGVLQSLTQRAGAPNNANAGVTTSLRLGGQSGGASARFIGQLDEIEVFNGTMTAAQVSALFATASPCAATLTLVAPYNNASYFAPGTIELVATGTGGITSVQFYTGANLIGTATGTLPFALTWNGVQPGSYTLTAKSGSVTSNPVTVTVVAAGGGPTVTTSTPNNGTTFYTAGSAHFGATPTAAPGHVIAKVEFYANGTLIGWSAGPPYEFTWRNLVPGTYTITAVVIDDAGVRVASTPFTITILAGSPSLVYYYNDVAGTPIAATDGNGSLLWDESYWPYGERYAHEDSGTQNGLWYTGKPTEDATGLSYYGGRWYNPSIGRFYSVDPQRFRENKALSFNRYSYGGNNPYRFLDPDGEDFVDLFPKDAPVVTLGQTIGGLAAYSQGLITGNKALEDVASPFAVENRQLYIGAAVIVLTTGRGGKADVPKYARGEYKTLSEAQRDVVLKKDAVCTYCGTAKSDTVDHIRSQKQDWLEGGWKDSRDARSARVNDPDNLAGACRSCNSSKQDKPLGAGQGGWSPD